MVKNKFIWVFIFYGLIFMESEAANPPFATPQQILQCQLSLQEISARLRQIVKDRANQKYYDNLYKQRQDFLKRLDTSPLNFLEAEEMWEQCQNLTKAIRMMRQPSVKEMPSLSPQGSYQSGLLTPRSLNRATVMEIRRDHRYRNRLQYMRHDYLKSKIKEIKEKKEGVGEEDNMEDFTFSLHSLHKKGSRTKSIVELEKCD
jgi:hypothetical protein